MLCTLNGNKAVGPDIISNRMLVSVKEEISKPLFLCVLIFASAVSVFVLNNICRSLSRLRDSRRKSESNQTLSDPFNNFNLAYDATQKSNVLNKYFCSITKLNEDDAVLPDFQIFFRLFPFSS
jgi:hypothetical protein